MKNYRFAFDLGTTSIGWAVFELDNISGKPINLARTNNKGENISFSPIGVRIFEDGRDPKNNLSNAAGRLAPRSARRSQDRRLARRAQLLKDLERASLLPSKGPERDALFALNPYEIRARAASERVSRFELGRALWHISKHRGFQSNRKSDQKEDDTGLIKSGTLALQAKMQERGHTSYGTFLWSQLQTGHGVRIRAKGINSDKHYEFYPTRDILKAEFDIIWREQSKHHELGDALRERLRDYTIFYQRALKPVHPGRCTFFPDQDRLPKWHPAAQSFLILQELANLRIIRETDELGLDTEQRKVLFDTLYGGEKLTWSRVRKALGLSSGLKLNLEVGGLKNLHFNQVAANLVGTKKKPGPLADIWQKLGATDRERILNELANNEDELDLIDWLKSEFGLDQATAEKAESIHLPDGHLRFCRAVAEALVYEMKSDAIDYNEAVIRAPLLSEADISHSEFRPDKGLDSLPRYNELENLRRMLGNGTGNPNDPIDKRLGKITNPTVHIALGQFRRVMNMLIHEFGKPTQIVLEAARDLSKSAKEKEEIERQIKNNTKRNDQYRAELEDADLLKPGQRVGDLFLKMRLWNELGANEADRRSPFTGKLISRADLLSDAVEIEHILPYAETFDDSPANKTLAFRDENRRKGKLSPSEAAELGIFEQDTITELTSHLPRNKAWRFQPDAMSVFEERRSFEDRQLHATGYLARVVRTYSETLFDKVDHDGKQRQHVWMLPGRMTSMLRHRWGLNLGDHNHKNRNDHRHHAIDAAVIGVIDRGMVKRLQDAARRTGAEALSRVLPSPPAPYEGYRSDVMSAVERIKVSHRPKHGSADPSNPSSTSGRLHEDTAYGPVRDKPENQADLTIGNLVVRKPVTSLTEKEIGSIRDVKLRLSAMAATEASRAAGLSKRDAERIRTEKLSEWANETGHHRIRILKRDTSVRPVRDKRGRAYKFFAPGEVAFVDIIEFEGQWISHASTVWDANSGQHSEWTDRFPNGRFVMRLHKGDTLQLFDWDEDEGTIVDASNTIKKVVRLVPSNNRLFLCGLNEAGKLQQRHEDEKDDFRWDWPIFDKLRLRRARRVRIDELGRVHTIPAGKV